MHIFLCLRYDTLQALQNFFRPLLIEYSPFFRSRCGIMFSATLHSMAFHPQPDWLPLAVANLIDVCF